MRYPDCEFSTWYLPVAVDCPSCGKSGAEKRATKSRGEYYKCLYCEQEFTVEEPETVTAES